MSYSEDVELRRAVVRLTVRFTALLVVLLVLVGGLVFFIVSAGSREAEARTLVEAAQIDSPADAPSGVLATIVKNGTVRQSRKMPAGLPDEAAIRRVASDGITAASQVTIAGHRYSIRTTSTNGKVVQVVMDQAESQEELQRLLGALVISGILSAIAAAVIAAGMARRAIRPLAHALELQRRFVADASHELRMPLTLLSTRAQLLRRRLSADGPGRGASVSSGIDEIVQDSRVLGEILEDLLIAADPRETASRAPLDVCASADEVVASLQSRAADRGLSLRRTGAERGVVIEGARVSISRLFTALIANAMDHAASHVTVDVSSDGTMALIRVSDDGPGFPDGIGERAFERFASLRPSGTPAGDARQGSSTAEHQVNHYGLGLALVAEVVARHGGTVSVEPVVFGRDGRTSAGASIRVRLPLAE